MTECRSAMTKGEWLEMLELLHVQHVNSLWVLADRLLEGLSAYAEPDVDLLAEASEQLEVSRHTLENYLVVVRRFPPGSRPHSPPLYLGHFALLTKLDDPTAFHWATQAWGNGWTVGKLRAELRARSDPDIEVVLPDPAAVEAWLWRKGIKAQVADHSLRFATEYGILTCTADTPLVWRLIEETD